MKKLILISTIVLSLCFTSSSLAAPPNDECPVIADVNSLEVGDDLTGYTVTQGTTVEPFNVEVLGIQENAFLPKHSIIIAKASGNPIDLAGNGIAAGMSGSPVYNDSGELVGAIAYGFSASPSPIAGITPASDMAKQLPETVALSSESRRVLQRETGTKSVGLKQLPTVISSSGRSVSPKMKKYFQNNNMIVSSPAADTPSGPSRSIASSSEMKAADTVTAYFSIGDTSVGGLGTTTYVCGDQFLGFGHPMLDAGADAPFAFAGKGDVYTYIVDEVSGPYKYGVLTEPIGSISTDTPWAIGGTLGEMPPSYDVEVRVENDDTGEIETTHTQTVSMPPRMSDKSLFEPYTISNAVYSTMQANSGTGYWGGGSAQADISIFGSSTQGPWQVNYSDYFDNPDQLSACFWGFCSLNPGSSSELLSGAVLGWSTAYQPLNININSVRVSVKSSEERKFNKITRVQWSTDKKTWRKGTAKVKKGENFYVKINSLNQAESSSSKILTMNAKKAGFTNVLLGSGQAMDPFWGMSEAYYQNNTFKEAVNYLNNSLPKQKNIEALFNKKTLGFVGGNLSYNAKVYGGVSLDVKVENTVKKKPKKPTKK
jgi:hypothetical protein